MKLSICWTICDFWALTAQTYLHVSVYVIHISLGYLSFVCSKSAGGNIYKYFRSFAYRQTHMNANSTVWTRQGLTNAAPRSLGADCVSEHSSLNSSQTVV